MGFVQNFLDKKKYRKIINHNVLLMQTQMLVLLNSESVGGNAGRIGRNPAAGANFIYNNLTGEIIKFTNDPAPVKGRFLVEIFIRSPEKPRIVKTFFDREPTEEVKRIIELSVQVYNKER